MFKIGDNEVGIMTSQPKSPSQSQKKGYSPYKALYGVRDYKNYHQDKEQDIYYVHRTKDNKLQTKLQVK